MSFFRFKIRPFFRTLGVIATCLWLALVIAYVADKATSRKETTSPKVLASPPTKDPAERTLTVEQENEQRESRLYGWGSPSRRRIGELLVDADMCVLTDFRTYFLTEFKDAFGARVSAKTLEAPSRENVLEVVMRALAKHAGPAGRVDEADTRAIAEYLAPTLVPDKDSRHYYWNTLFKAEKNKEGFWSVYVVTDWKESEQITSNRKGLVPDEKSFREALRRLPLAYGLYLSSLVAERTQGIADMDNLLALPEKEQHALRAIAKYRRARLTMSLDDWPRLTDEQVKRRLAAIRSDLEAVAVHAAEGSLDPHLISQNAKYWLAYSRSMILPPARLRKLSEADFAGAFATYLGMPERGDANAVNSCYRLAAHLSEASDYAGCVNDPDLRQLITLYLCAEGSNGYGTYVAKDLLNSQIDGWLDALVATKVGFAFDPLRIAILQHRAGRWEDCLKTLKLVPPDHPMRTLLRSRCALRLSGDLAKAGELLTPEADEAASLTSLRRGASNLITPDKHDFTVLIDLQKEEEMRLRISGERGVIKLVQGDFKEAFRHFTLGHYLSEANYVGECLLTLEELKSVVDSDKEPKPDPVDKIATTEEWNPWDERIMTPRALLASKLFRAGRLEEALAYVAPKLRANATTYVLFRRLAERMDISDHARADAYWRSSCLIRMIGEDILRAPVGLNWTSYVGVKKDEVQWYVPYQFLPHIRLNQVDERYKVPVNILLSASKEEALRLQTWLAEHVDKPVRSERDARYAAFDLAIKAARHLPDNDPAGGEILQYAGNLLKYREPKAANPAYVLIVTRFKQTPYGEHALKRHWFSKETPEPSSDVISK
jgi:hypothetical protein